MCKKNDLNSSQTGTPYENGVFRMKLILSHDFPHSPPKGLTAIGFNYNIHQRGKWAGSASLGLEFNNRDRS
ncbi:unnamed protein product [Camellia sinensis]